MNIVFWLLVVIYFIGILVVFVNDMAEYTQKFNRPNPIYKGGLKQTVKNMWFWPSILFKETKAWIKRIWIIEEE